MKDRDFKMRQRFEQKEYYPDKSGYTRAEKIQIKKLNKQYDKEKRTRIEQGGQPPTI